MQSHINFCLTFAILHFASNSMPLNVRHKISEMKNYLLFHSNKKTKKHNYKKKLFAHIHRMCVLNITVQLHRISFLHEFSISFVIYSTQFLWLLSLLLLWSKRPLHFPTFSIIILYSFLLFICYYTMRSV